MYLYAYSRSKVGDTGSLLSPQFPSTSATCIGFRYFLRGSVGGITVSLTYSGGKKELVKFTGDHGYKWLEYQVRFKSPVTYKVSVR